MPYIHTYPGISGSFFNLPPNNTTADHPQEDNRMKYIVKYRWKKLSLPNSSWTSTIKVTVTATSDYMAEKIVQGKHPGCEIRIESIEEG